MRLCTGPVQSAFPPASLAGRHHAPLARATRRVDEPPFVAEDVQLDWPNERRAGPRSRDFRGLLLAHSRQQVRCRIKGWQARNKLGHFRRRFSFVSWLDWHRANQHKPDERRGDRYPQYDSWLQMRVADRSHRRRVTRARPVVCCWRGLAGGSRRVSRDRDYQGLRRTTHDAEGSS